jgi:hypothetical protein
MFSPSVVFDDFYKKQKPSIRRFIRIFRTKPHTLSRLGAPISARAVELRYASTGNIPKILFWKIYTQICIFQPVFMKKSKI